MKWADKGSFIFTLITESLVSPVIQKHRGAPVSEFRSRNDQGQSRPRKPSASQSWNKQLFYPEVGQEFE